MKTQRVVWADLLRVLAIYLVLVVHSPSSPGSLSIRSLNLQPLISWIAASCVPLFVMLSGALLLEKKESYHTFFKKRGMKLLLPWITWTIIYVFLSPYSHSVSELLRTLLTTFESFWFLPMILGLYLLTPALRMFLRAAKTSDVWFLIALWFAAVSLLPYTRNSLMFPRQVDDGILRQVIHFLGYYLLGFVLIRTKIPKAKYVALLCIACGIFWSYAGTTIASIGEHTVTQDFSAFISPGIVFISMGIFLLIFSSRKLLEKYVVGNWRKILILLSSASLGIYFAHLPIQQLLFTVFHTPSFFIGVPFENYLNAMVLFFTSFLAILALFQIPKVKNFIG